MEAARLQRERDKEEQLRRQAEAVAEQQRLQSEEESIWAALTVEEANQLRGMLQAVALYRQQLQQTEHVATDLQQQITGQEKACRSQRRRALQAAQEEKVAHERRVKQAEDVARWEKKRLQYEE